MQCLDYLFYSSFWFKDDIAPSLSGLVILYMAVIQKPYCTEAMHILPKYYVFFRLHRYL